VYRDGVLVTHYEYDENGNRLSRITSSEAVAGMYDNQDRLLSYGSVNYTYKDSGELLSRMGTASGETTLYNYDARGFLRQITLPDGTTIDYVIDGLGRRVGKKVNGALVKGWLYGSALSRRGARRERGRGGEVRLRRAGERARGDHQGGSQAHRRCHLLRVPPPRARRLPEGRFHREATRA
jgi:YD repeat-containing protein